MAFGGVKGIASDTATSVVAANALAVASIAVSVGDLVFALFVEQTARTVTGVIDNRGNTYTALQAGTDAGAVTARAFYSRVTNAGTLTSITFAASASSNDCIMLAAVFEGPFSTLDQNPADITSDITSPFLCPPTGVLSQADELVVAWSAASHAVTWAAVAPMVDCVVDLTATGSGIIASKVVAATTSTTPSFTAAANPTQAILATSTFRKVVTETITVTKATVTFTGQTVTPLTPAVTITPATVTLTGKDVTVRESDLIPVAQAAVTLAGKTVSLVDTSSTLSVVSVDKADVAVVGQAVALSDNLIVDKAAVVITGKPVAISGAIPVAQATMLFTGRTVTVSTSSFEDIPKYIIRGRGSRHGISGRGSRVLLVTR